MARSSKQLQPTEIVIIFQDKDPAHQTNLKVAGRGTEPRLGYERIHSMRLEPSVGRQAMQGAPANGWLVVSAPVSDLDLLFQRARSFWEPRLPFST